MRESRSRALGTILVLAALLGMGCDEYLIITPDAFVADLKPLIEAREGDGLTVKVVKLSQIGTNPTAAQIASFIKKEYDKTTSSNQLFGEHLRYVLLVGDVDKIPTHYRTDSGLGSTYNPVASDLYYATMDSGSYLPHIAVGRLPVKTSAELKALVKKIVQYSPKSTKALLFGNSPETTYASGDGALLKGAGFSVEYSIDKPASNEIARLNAGKALAVYYGHGWKTSMSSSLDTTNISQLTNTELPVILSGGCATAWFDEASGDSLGEALLLDPKHGAIAFIGSTRTGGYGYAYKFIDGFIGEFSNSGRLGDMLTEGRLAAYYAAADASADVSWGSAAHSAMEQITLLGDPALKLNAKAAADELLPRGYVSRYDEHRFLLPGGNYRIRMTGTGDADLYVRYGSPPTTSDFTCRPYTEGSTENCDVANSSAAVYVMVRGYAAYSAYELHLE
jgi:hypothetical protein